MVVLCMSSFFCTQVASTVENFEFSMCHRCLVIWILCKIQRCPAIRAHRMHIGQYWICVEWENFTSDFTIQRRARSWGLKPELGVRIRIGAPLARRDDGKDKNFQESDLCALTHTHRRARVRWNRRGELLVGFSRKGKWSQGILAVIESKHFNGSTATRCYYASLCGASLPKIKPSAKACRTIFNLLRPKLY